MFAMEAERIRCAFGALALSIEHVGSTAVPGLQSKPVIDIQLSVQGLSPLSRYLAPLKTLGYTHFPLGEFDQVYPFFKRPAEWPSTHHIHLCDFGGEQEARHLAFRNFLRRHSDVAQEYRQLKLALAARHHGSTLESQESYSLAKGTFVEAVLERAKQDGSWPGSDAQPCAQADRVV